MTKNTNHIDDFLERLDGKLSPINNPSFSVEVNKDVGAHDISYIDDQARGHVIHITRQDDGSYAISHYIDGYSASALNSSAINGEDAAEQIKDFLLERLEHNPSAKKLVEEAYGEGLPPETHTDMADKPVEKAAPAPAQRL